MRFRFWDAGDLYNTVLVPKLNEGFVVVIKDPVVKIGEFLPTSRYFEAQRQFLRRSTEGKLKIFICSSRKTIKRLE